MSNNGAVKVICPKTGKILEIIDNTDERFFKTSRKSLEDHKKIGYQNRIWGELDNKKDLEELKEDFSCELKKGGLNFD